MIKKMLIVGACFAALGAVVTAAPAGADGNGGAYKVVDDGIPKPLTSAGGDVERGRKAMIDRKLGNCLACHAVSALSDQPFHGEVGPTLDGVAERYDVPQLRLLVVDSKMVFEDTIMPAFYRSGGLKRVAGKFKDKTILSAQNVEDIIAYLQTLKE